MIGRATVGAIATIAAYVLLIYLENGYLTRRGETMLGVLIIAAFGFVLGIGFLYRRRKPPSKRD